MERLLEQLGCRRDLDERAEVHHRHPVAHEPDHPEVMRHEEVREPEALAQLDEEVQDLGADGDVEGRDGLVGDDQPWADGERPRDPDPLALPAAELVRVA